MYINKKMNKKELIELISSLDPKSSIRLEGVYEKLITDIDLLGDGVIVTVNNKQVIYRIVNDQLMIYKAQKIGNSNDISKWKSIIRHIKLNKLEDEI